MNKQDIFPLYVGKCRVKLLKAEHSKTYAYEGINYPQIFLELEGHHKSAIIPDCQLILKRISDMSYENWVELSGYVFDLKLVNETAITMRDLLCNGDGAVLSLKSMTKIMFWLIQNGYALSDDWFTNGIAVEEKTK